MRVEQAIFTSLQGERLDGYQLAVTSAGVSDETARVLTAWGPAHDSLLDPSPVASCINFHPVGDDLYALSRTTRSGQEYSGRGGGRIVTQFFLLTRDMLTRFAYSPLQILKALTAAGRTRVADPLPDKLDAFPLVGRAIGEPRDDTARRFDAAALDRIAQLARDQQAVGVVASEPGESWLKGVIARLDPADRLNLSFTTGLRPTACRPFLLCVLPDESATIRQSQRSGGMTVVYLTTRAASETASA